MIGKRISDVNAGFATPFLVVRESALDHNVKAMAGFCDASGVVLAPHAKTTMCPPIFGRQLAAGAWALTAADPGQAEVLARFGARRILIANQVIDPAGIRKLTRLLDTGVELCCYVDSIAGVRALEEGARRAELPRPIPVLLEHGVAGGRCGVRTHHEAMAVAEQVNASSGVALIGVSCFEGVLSGDSDAATLSAVRELCDSVRQLGEALVDRGRVSHGIDGLPLAVPSLVLSAGGSQFFDVVAAEFGRSRAPGTQVVLRSGCYVTHDHGVYARKSPVVRDARMPTFRPAIEVHTTVLSRPQQDLVVLNAGRRDLSFDAGLPVTLNVADTRVAKLNDQHAFVTVPPSSALDVGDRVALGISHPCTTMDKWRTVIVVDDGDRVVEIGSTYF